MGKLRKLLANRSYHTMFSIECVCFNWKNAQPLEKSVNLSKNNKYDNDEKKAYFTKFLKEYNSTNLSSYNYSPSKCMISFRNHTFFIFKPSNTT